MNLNKTDFDKITNWIPDAVIDLRYLGSDNLFGFPIYKEPYDILRVGTLKRLKKVADILREQEYHLVIWDAYRPLEVQQFLWDKIGDPKFVAHPSTGSKHNRGCAVDVTLADKNGNYLEMPSAFDDFSDKAKADLNLVDEPIKTNLRILQEAMSASGFEILDDEWWHFTDEDSKDYDLV